jgi:PII-like signaling protein
MTPPIKLLLVFIDETDRWDETPLYEAIVRRLRQLGVAGATVHAGLMGFGGHQQVHRKRLFGVSDDRPVTITVVDNEETLRRVVPEVRHMVQEGLVILLDAELVL